MLLPLLLGIVATDISQDDNEGASVPNRHVRPSLGEDGTDYGS